MIKALVAFLVFASGAALCFQRAYKIQSQHARPDGQINGPARSRVFLWVLAGGMFIVLALIGPFAAVEPGFVFGKR